MKDWKRTKSLYKITEISKSNKEEYAVVMTGDEIMKYCKSHREAHGYVAGTGGDRTYDCIAVLCD